MATAPPREWPVTAIARAPQSRSSRCLKNVADGIAQRRRIAELHPERGDSLALQFPTEPGIEFAGRRIPAAAGPAAPDGGLPRARDTTGSASCRERVGPYVEISVGA